MYVCVCVCMCCIYFFTSILLLLSVCVCLFDFLIFFLHLRRFHKLSSGSEEAFAVPSIPEKEQSDANVANFLLVDFWVSNANHHLASSKEVKVDATVNHVFAAATTPAFNCDLPVSYCVIGYFRQISERVLSDTSSQCQAVDNILCALT